MVKPEAVPPQALSLRQWWDLVGTENVTRVVAEVGTSLNYMRILRYRRKRPGYDLAKRIIAAANKLTPGFTPDLEQLMAPIEKRAPNPTYSPRIQPSEVFLRAMSVERLSE